MATFNIRIVVDAAQATKGTDQVRRGLKNTENAADRLQKSLVRLAGAYVSVQTIRRVGELADTYSVLQNRLRVVTESQEQLTRATNDLFQVAQDTRSSFEGTVTIFSRLAANAKELGVNQQQLIQFTRSLNQAIKVSGASSIEANNALIQLSQGLASGALRGDELRSVLEQLPFVADVIAKGLGVTRGQLRELGAQGKITSQDILRSFAEAREEIEDRFGKTVPTLAESFQVLGNSVLEAFGKFDQAAGISRTLSELLIFLSENIEGVIEVGKILASIFGTLLAAKAIPQLISAINSLGIAIKSALPIGLLISAVQVLDELAAFDEIAEKLAIREQLLKIQDEVNAQQVFDFLKFFGKEGLRIAAAVRKDIEEEIAEIPSLVPVMTDEQFKTLQKQRTNIREFYRGLQTEIDLLRLSSKEAEHRATVLEFESKIGRKATEFEQGRLAAMLAVRQEEEIRSGILRSATDAQNEYNEALRIATDLYAEGEISANQFNEAIERTQLGAERARLEQALADPLTEVGEVRKAFEDRNRQIQELLEKGGLEQLAANDKFVQNEILLSEQLTEVIDARRAELEQALARPPTALEQTRQAFQERLDLIQQFVEEEILTRQEANDFMTQNEIAFAQDLQEIQAQRVAEAEATSRATTQANQALIASFGQIIGAVSQGVDQQSDAYRALFAIQKAFALASALVNAQKAVSDALATEATLPQKIAAVASVTSLAAQIIATLQAVTPGFQTGGSFRVGGAGGADSQLVAFRASPNERVTVETPAQQQVADRQATAQMQPGQPQQIRIVNVTDPGLLSDFLTSPQGEQTIINTISRNQEQVSQILRR